MQMKLVKSVDSNGMEMGVDCIFFKTGNYCVPIMVLPGYLFDNFHAEYKELLKNISRK